MAVFTILDDGETLITGEWVPDPEQLSIKMAELADYYDNMLPALEASKAAAIESTELHFETESDSKNQPWPELNEDYLNDKVAAGFPEDEMLVRTGKGKAAAISPGSWFIAEDALWFDPNALPQYMDYHQSGTSTETQAFRDVLSKLRRKESITSEEAGIASTASAGRGQNLPKREFVGFSEEDLAVFESIWNGWFAEGLAEEFPTGGSGGIIVGGQTGFNMLGEFPIMGRTGRGQPILRTPKGPRFGRF